MPKIGAALFLPGARHDDDHGDDDEDHGHDDGDNDGDGCYGDVVLPGRSQPPLS